MSDIKGKLDHLLQQNRALMSGAEWRTRLAALEQERAEGTYEIDKVVSGTLAGDESGGFYHVCEDFPLEYPHGNIELAAGLDVLGEHIAFAACDSDLDAFDPTTALYIDTETTGLSGGTGTVAFLVGVGYFHEGRFRLEQCFMRDFDDEEPMLRHLDALFQRCETVVTYNGKSFDLPLLRTRFISNRIPFRLDSALHFDLVHASRRFWRQRLRNCGLGNVERSILGVERHGDVDSAEIPQLWFDYLRSRDARKLDRVFYHHKYDILSLVALTAWLSRCLGMPEGNGFEHSEDRLSLLRVQFRQKQYPEVIQAAQRLLEEQAETVIRHECLELLGYAYKRLQDWEGLQQACEWMLREHPANLAPRLELAKLHEHRTRNLSEAERVSREAIELLETRAALDRALDAEQPFLDLFRHRLERIQRKRAKYGPAEE